MHIFCGEDINSVYLLALETIRSKADLVNESRAGKVFDLGPAYFEFTNAKNQFLTLKDRNYNPYFAIIEAAWVLSGSNDLRSLSKVLSGYDKYSDDGTTLNGAYGYRIKKYFNKDQLESVINLLFEDPSSRRAVITLYSTDDLDNKKSSDIPCNTSLFFKIRNKKLDITVINRSNDIFLGIPYNVFIFNTIQRYVAIRLNLPLGIQRHFTDSLHLYERDFSRVDEIIKANTCNDILLWKEKPIPDYIFTALIHEFEAISLMNFDSILCKKTRVVLENYIQLKNGGKKNDFIKDLPDDIFGISSMLWAKSRK